MSQRPVSDVIKNRKFDAIVSKATAAEAARLMKSHHTSAVLVVNSKHLLVGICTERDLVVEVIAAGLDPEKTDVETIMTRHPVTIGPDQPFCHALHRMYEGGFRHVPVVDEVGRPLGLLAARDGLMLDAKELEEDLVRREEITVIL